MLPKKKIPLTAAEIGTLWTAYMNDSMSACVLEVILQHIQYPDIKPSIQQSYDMSSSHLEQLRIIFESENYAVPTGFNKQDINLEAPWVFTDVFCLTYVNNMAKVGMIAYSGFLAMSVRKDIRNYFTQALTATTALYNQTTEVALAKGIDRKSVG